MLDDKKENSSTKKSRRQAAREGLEAFGFPCARSGGCPHIGGTDDLHKGPLEAKVFCLKKTVTDLNPWVSRAIAIQCPDAPELAAA